MWAATGAGSPLGEVSVRLMFAMRYSSEVERMTEFYRDGLGIGTASESPYFVEFRSGMTSFSLLAIHPGETVHFELCFAVDDIESAITELRARSMEFTDELRSQPFGKLIHMRDPDGNVVTLLEPSRPSASRGEPHLAALIINTWDFGRTVMFYRDRLGLPVLAEFQGHLAGFVLFEIFRYILVDCTSFGLMPLAVQDIAQPYEQCRSKRLVSQPRNQPG